MANRALKSNGRAHSLEKINGSKHLKALGTRYSKARRKKISKVLGSMYLQEAVDIERFVKSRQLSVANND